MALQNGIISQLQNKFNDDEIIKIVSITSSKTYDLNGHCGGKSVWRSNANSLIQQNPNIYFHSDLQNCWIIINFKKRASVTGIAFQASTVDCSNLQGFYLLGSSDGLKWNNITHEIGPIIWKANEWVTFTFPQRIYQYFQFYQDPSKDSTVNERKHYFHISRIDFIGSLLESQHSFCKFSRISRVCVVLYVIVLI